MKRDNSLRTFGQQAQALAKNPLGIIALFILLVYALAVGALGIGTAASFPPFALLLLVWFIVVFPVLVLASFVYLVIKHHSKLYGPADFKDQAMFKELALPGSNALKPAVQVKTEPEKTLEAVVDDEDSDLVGSSPTKGPGSLMLAEGETTHVLPDAEALGDIEDWSSLRQSTYAEARYYQLVHRIWPTPDGHFDILISIQSHKSPARSQVTRAEFFFGKSWQNKIYNGVFFGDRWTQRVLAFGPFLCICRLTFDDGKQAVLYRYIDLEMADSAKVAALVHAANETQVSEQTG